MLQAIKKFSMNKRIVFFGNERLATGVVTTAPTLRNLINHNYDVAAVVVNYTAAQSRTAASRELEVIKIAETHGIPVLAPRKLSEITETLASLNATAGVLLAYGRIIPESIIHIFPRGIINIHPSLLPLHRGSMPIEAVMLEGARETGVSLMQLAKEMDAGPVFAQARLPLTGQESKQELYDKLLGIGNGLLMKHLPAILDGSLTPKPQDHSKATYDQLITKDQGIIDWNKPAQQIEREIRAYLEWPKSRTELAGKDIIITKAYVDPSETMKSKPGDVEFIKESGIIIVGTASGLLRIERLKPAGKREMSAKEFMTGYIL